MSRKAWKTVVEMPMADTWETKSAWNSFARRSSPGPRATFPVTLPNLARGPLSCFLYTFLHILTFCSHLLELLWVSEWSGR